MTASLASSVEDRWPNNEPDWALVHHIASLLSSSLWHRELEPSANFCVSGIYQRYLNIRESRNTPQLYVRTGFASTITLTA